MADWRGRGKGRNEGQPSLNLKGGAGMGGGRPGSQPSLDIQGGAGKGGGRPGSQPSLDIQGGAGKGGGRPGSQPSLDIQGGAGKGGGRAGSQPSLGAKVDFGGASLSFSLKGSSATTTARGETSIGKATGSQTSPRVADPEGNFMFYLVLGNSTDPVAQFKEASGLKSSTQVFELEEGGVNHRVHKLPGQSRWDNLVLRYGVSADTQLATWRNEVLSDEFGKRKSGSIVMMTIAGEEVRRYNFTDGWPVAWEGPHFSADGAEVAVEMIEIAHSGLQIS
jgi:phage tail-like protein